MKFIPLLSLIIFSTMTLQAESATQGQEQDTIIAIQALQETTQQIQEESAAQKALLLQQGLSIEGVINTSNISKKEVLSEVASLKQLSQNFQKNIASAGDESGVLKKQLVSLISRVDQQNISLAQQAENIDSLVKAFDARKIVFTKSIQQQSQKISALESSLIASKTDFTSRVDSLNLGVTETQSKLSTLDQDMGGKVKQLGYWIVLVALIGGFGVALGILVRKRLSSNNGQLEENLSRMRAKMEEENVKLDTKFVELLQGQMRLPRDRTLPSTAISDTPEIDHSLQLKVGEEITRMRQRFKTLPQDIKGLKPLMKSLERLEDEFNRKGYELVDMLGKPFDDGLNVKARFIPSDDLNPGERIINKIIKPQINFNGVSIRVAEIEVITGG